MVLLLNKKREISIGHGMPPVWTEQTYEQTGQTNAETAGMVQQQATFFVR